MKMLCCTTILFTLSTNLGQTKKPFAQNYKQTKCKALIQHFKYMSNISCNSDRKKTIRFFVRVSGYLSVFFTSSAISDTYVV